MTDVKPKTARPRTAKPKAAKSSSVKATPAKPKAVRQVVPKPANDEAPLSLVDLARGVISREIKPGVAQMRRLAEGVIEAAERKARKAAKKGEGKKADKKRKLAKIPARKK